MTDRVVPLCKKTMATYLTIALLLVLLCLAIGYFLFRSPGRGREIAPPSTGAITLVL
jgi:hypothetical protein